MDRLRYCRRVQLLLRRGLFKMLMPPAKEEEEKNDKSDEHELFKFHLQLICKIAAHDQFYEED